jgi:uncharacterized protein
MRGKTMTEQKHLIDTITNLKEPVYKKYKATLKGILGSYARDEAKEDSDVDILVEFQQNATLLDLAGLGNFLEEKLHRRVDLCSQNSIREELKPYIYKEIIYI